MSPIQHLDEAARYERLAREARKQEPSEQASSRYEAMALKHRNDARIAIEKRAASPVRDSRSENDTAAAG